MTLFKIIMFDFMSMIIGLFVGIFITMIICGASYYSRVFIFTGCANVASQCRSEQYYSDPGDALANGAVLD